jgi:hypothetical protein
MGKVVLPLALEAEVHGFQNQMDVCNSEGTAFGVFLPLTSYKRLLAEVEIPYSEEELKRRRQEKDGLPLEEFWRTVPRS